MRRKGFSKAEINIAINTLKSFFNDPKPFQVKIEKLKLVKSNKINNIIKNFLLENTKNGICHPQTTL